MKAPSRAIDRKSTPTPKPMPIRAKAPVKVPGVGKVAPAARRASPGGRAKAKPVGRKFPTIPNLGKVLAPVEKGSRAKPAAQPAPYAQIEDRRRPNLADQPRKPAYRLGSPEEKAQMAVGRTQAWRRWVTRAGASSVLRSRNPGGRPPAR